MLIIFGCLPNLCYISIFFDISASFTPFFAASFFLWFVSAGLLTVLWALAIGLLGNFMLEI
jgi:predicted membrane channel-forming protein YqfA (hemolysin III family)